MDSASSRKLKEFERKQTRDELKKNKPVESAFRMIAEE
jgi:hypothetical protein